jgi:hypothetical protein
MMDPPTFFRRVVYIAHLRILYFNITSRQAMHNYSSDSW